MHRSEEAVPTQPSAREYGTLLAFLKQTQSDEYKFSRLPAPNIGQIVDRGVDFPASVQKELDHYGSGMWHFRDQPENKTTRAVNRYTGELRE